MTSEVIVEMPICPSRTIIRTENAEYGSVNIHITSTCSHVRDYAKVLQSADMMDLTTISDSKILKLAEQSHITPTCLVPVAVYNACWAECGMISKTTAKNSPTSTISFNLD